MIAADKSDDFSELEKHVVIYPEKRSILTRISSPALFSMSIFMCEPGWEGKREGEN